MALSKINLKYFTQKFLEYKKINLNIKYPQLPERLKGTIVERWSEYWTNLFRDYMEVLKDTTISAKEHPVRTGTILGIFGFGMYCSSNNPDEISYRDAIISSSSEMIFVGPSIRNPKCVKYLKEIEDSYNEGTLHRLSFGLFSIVWRDDYNSHVGIYKAQCSYLGVPFYKCYERIIDVGFLNRWLILEKTMEDYDINPEEWIQFKEEDT